MSQIRLASYNIRKCVGRDGRRAPERVIGVLNALGADIVAVQEADRRLGPRPAALPRAMIEAETDFTPVLAATNSVSLGWHGNALLLRRGIEVACIERLDLPGFEPRGAVLVEAGTGLGSLRIIGVHLGLMRRHRRRQLTAIRAVLQHRVPMPTAILGDFNEWSLAEGMCALKGAFDVHAPGRSFPTHAPVGRLDRIALSAEFDLAAAGVHDTRDARRASDHLPVWADVALAG